MHFLILLTCLFHLVHFVFEMEEISKVFQAKKYKKVLSKSNLNKQRKMLFRLFFFWIKFCFYLLSHAIFTFCPVVCLTFDWKRKIKQNTKLYIFSSLFYSWSFILVEIFRFTLLSNMVSFFFHEFEIYRFLTNFRRNRLSNSLMCVWKI